MKRENKDKLYALQRALDKIYFSESFKSPYDTPKPLLVFVSNKEAIKLPKSLLVFTNKDILSA